MSSFGYSGTIVHAVLQVNVAQEAALTAEKSLSSLRQNFERRDFSWIKAKHPFVQKPPSASATEQDSTFVLACAGALYSIVADHVLQGRVIFPGAAYLEAARAASCYVEVAAGLHRVHFLHPLAVETAGLHVQCVVSQGRFELRSGKLIGGLLDEASVHSSGYFGVISKGPRPLFAHAEERSCRTGHAVVVPAFYNVFESVQLQYGPEYRRLSRVWRGAQIAVSQLHVRTRWQSTKVHPADLDAALQLSGIILDSEKGSDGGSEGGAKTLVPFSVDNAELHGAPRNLWAVSFGQ